MSGFLQTTITAVVTALLLGWATGLFNSIVPSPPAFVALVKDLLSATFVFFDVQNSEKFVVLVASLSGDDSTHTHTLAVERAFRGDRRITRRRRYRVFWPSIDHEPEARAIRGAQKLLTRRRAHLLIWGEVVKKEELISLWFTSRDRDNDFQETRFRLDANLLGPDFDEASTAALVAVGLSAVKPIRELQSEVFGRILEDTALRLRHLLNQSAALTLLQRSELQAALVSP